jgi:hypothetical protein
MSRPDHADVQYRGIPHRLDLVRCRRALVHRQVEGTFTTMNDLANFVGRSRSTTTRFFSGRNTSLAVTLSMLAALRLEFAEVATPVDGF